MFARTLMAVLVSDVLVAMEADMIDQPDEVAGRRFRKLAPATRLADTISSQDAQQPEPNPEDGPLRELRELT